MKLIKVLTLIVLVIVILVLVFCYYKKSSDRKAIFGINYSVIKEIYSDDTERDFHENGFSITVDSISDNDVKYFSNPPKEFFTDYPTESFHSTKYEIHTWKKTPINIKDTADVDFALNLSIKDTDSYVFKNRAAVIQNLTILSKKLNEPGNLYSFAFRSHPHKLYGIDLYLIDVRQRKIYIVNRQ